MLVLTRRKGECVQIGPDVFVKVVGFGRDRVLLGVTAPKATTILREEVIVRTAAGQATAQDVEEEGDA